jgi:hypothetical protein
MKAFLVFAAALGFTVSSASAECAGHSKVSAPVDMQTKAVSVAKTDMSSTVQAQTNKEEAPPRPNATAA